MLLTLPGLLVAIVFHEYAHARVADAMGDPTPGATGRLTLNPLAHLDPIGSLMLLVFHFGWAKPVMVNPNAFADPRRGMMLVALAGPLSNVLQAYLALVLAQLLPLSTVGLLLLGGVYWYNVYLAVFNIIPVPPLDGSKVLAGLLPPEHQGVVRALEQYGWLVLILLLVTGAIGPIMGPVVRGLNWLLTTGVGALAGGL